MSLPAILEQKLQTGLEHFGMAAACQPLATWLLLLQKWNKAYNLTAVREPAEMIDRHILDSLAIAPWLKGPRILDAGSGAGLPGIPLAITHPQWQFVLMDSNGKKIRFLQEVKRVLGLDNVEIVHTRAEDYRPSSGFDTVTSRAFCELSQLLDWTGHLLAPQGIWLAMKGRYPQAELDAIKQVFHVNSYSVPGLDSERCCVIIENLTKE